MFNIMYPSFFLYHGNGSFMDSLNKFFSYLFINSKINSLLFFESYMRLNVTNPENSEGFAAKIIYKKQIRRYLGLGFFLSFIPGTEAFKARENLFAIIVKLEPIDTGTLPARLISSPLHIFFRTFAAIAYFNIEFSLSQILFRKNDIGGLNRLNPFLYTTKLFFIIFKRNEYLMDLIFFNSKIPFIIRIPIFLLGAVVLVILALVAVLYFITELVLNSLNTLFIEPIQFVFAALHQFVTSWVTSIPTADYSKVHSIVRDVEPRLSNRAKTYHTKELTLIESSEDVINSYDKHHNSFFYNFYKDRDLLKLTTLPIFQESILIAYNQFENLRKFSYFTHKEIRNEFPKELNQKIIDNCLELDDNDRMNYLMKLMKISSEEVQASENTPTIR